MDIIIIDSRDGCEYKMVNNSFVPRKDDFIMFKGIERQILSIRLSTEINGDIVKITKIRISLDEY